MPEVESNTEIVSRSGDLFKDQHHNLIVHTDRLFARLMVFQWAAAMAAALWIAPRTWAGTESKMHLHVWAAVLLGALITSLPVLMALRHSGKVLTRHVIAVGQMLTSALLIHLTGGRIETHFHVFGSLAILAFYRDWRVLISATAVVYVDHLLRGFFWPESVYGVMAAPIWRSFEHAGWVLFEVTFLIIAMRKSLSEMESVAERQARLETLKEGIERKVAERTSELTRENLERRQAEEELKKSQSQLAQAQQIARLGSWEWNVVENKVTWSEQTARLYGFRPEDVGSRMEQCLERIHPEDVARVRLLLEQAVKKGTPYECDHRVIHPDGSERIMHGRGEVIVNSAGQVDRIIGTVQDVTEAKRGEEALRKSEAQLRQAQKMEAVGRLAGGVAHDFNNLLTVIGGYSDLMLQRAAADHPDRRNLEEIQNASQRASALTRQLLAFSRKQVLQFQVLDLNEIVGRMDKMLRRLIGEDIELRAVFGQSLGKVKADPGQLEQVILNMVVNARDAMPRGGKVTICTSNVAVDQTMVYQNRGLEAGEYVMLSISDTGVGMTDEVKAHLFEPFFTTKGIDKGTGLGLATCYGIIRQSDGDIHVYSEANRGTTFKVYLPRTDATTDPETAPKHLEPPPNGTESVLVVEDEASVRTFAVSVLRERGYRVQEAVSGPEALAIMERQPDFDLVVTDVIMPQMSGRELYDRVKARGSNLKVLFMSGYTDDALAHHGVLEEKLSFVEKPFSPARLARKVREVLDAPGAGQT